MTFRLPHLIAALLLHAVLVGLVAYGAQFQPMPQRPPIISAVLLDPSRQETARQKRLDEERRKAAAAEEATRRLQAEQQKKRELEKQRVAAAALKKQKEDEARKQKQAAEKQKVQDAARTKREAEERSRMAQAIREEEMRRELEREQAGRAASERDRKLALWAEALIAHVAGNFSIPPGAPADFECKVRLQLLPDGTVTDAKIVKSCGSALLDKSVEDAVYRSSPMPKPSDPSVFDRDLTINFKPNS